MLFERPTLGASPIAITNAVTPMEVPFISSGALSRAHYVLVRKVELAQSTQQADDYLLEEVVALRDRLSRPGFSSVGPVPFSARSFVERPRPLRHNVESTLLSCCIAP